MADFTTKVLEQARMESHCLLSTAPIGPRGWAHQTAVVRPAMSNLVLMSTLADWLRKSNLDPRMTYSARSCPFHTYDQCL